MDDIKTITLKNVTVQQNGIIRNEKGYLIGRLVDGVDFEGDHVLGQKTECNAVNDFVKKMETHIVRNYGQVKDGKIIFTWEESQKALSDFSAALVTQIKQEMPEVITLTGEVTGEHKGYHEALEDLNRILKKFQ